MECSSTVVPHLDLELMDYEKSPSEYDGYPQISVGTRISVGVSKYGYPCKYWAGTYLRGGGWGSIPHPRPAPLTLLPIREPQGGDDHGMSSLPSKFRRVA